MGVTENVRQIVEGLLAGKGVEQLIVDALVRRLSERMEQVRVEAHEDGYRTGRAEGYDQGWRSAK